MKYVAKFERIGRNHHVADLEFEARNADEAAHEIWKYARVNMASRDVEVVVDLEEGTGMIYAGLHNGGSFTVEEARA